MSGVPKTEDEIYEEARAQLAKIMMTQEHTVYNIERQSKEVSEYPISMLAQKAGFRNTREFLEGWFDDLLDFDGQTVRAFTSLYDTPELQHIISLQERTKMKTKKGGGGRGRGRGRGAARVNMGNRNIVLRPPPAAAIRRNDYGPPSGAVPPPRRQVSPPGGFAARPPGNFAPPRRQPSPPPGNFAFRRQPSPGQSSFGSSSRRQLSPDRESFSSSLVEPPSTVYGSGRITPPYVVDDFDEPLPPQRRPIPLNRVSSPYRDEERREPPHDYAAASRHRRASPYFDDRRSSPSQSIHLYTSAGTQPLREQQPYPVRREPFAYHPQQNDVHDYAERSPSLHHHRPGPPPGFADHRPHIEVSARRYEDVTPTRNNFEYDDDDDPFGIDTARTFNNAVDDYVNVRTYHPEDDDIHRRSPPHRNNPRDFYDNEFREQEFHIPDRSEDPRYDDRRRPSSPPRQGNRFAAARDEYYQDGYRRDSRDYTPPSPPPQDYASYDHHRINGILRERNIISHSPENEQDDQFHDAIDEYLAPEEPHYNSLPPEAYYDSHWPVIELSPRNVIELPPCRTFNVSTTMPNLERLLNSRNCHDISAEINHSVFREQDLSTHASYSRNYIDYFAEVITDIHYVIFDRPAAEASFEKAIKELQRKIILEPGYDSYSIFCVMRALGSQFFSFFDDNRCEPEFAVLFVRDNLPHKTDDAEYKRTIKGILFSMMPVLDIPQLTGETRAKAVIIESKNKDFPYFVKLGKFTKDEKELENTLRSVKTYDMVFPHIYPRALCIYYHNDGNEIKPYRAQIIAQLHKRKVTIELVDVGAFLTVFTADLKRVEGDVLAIKPRFAIPVELENYGVKKIPLEQAKDGFPRRSTNEKSISMILTPKNKYMSMTLD